MQDSAPQISDERETLKDRLLQVTATTTKKDQMIYVSGIHVIRFYGGGFRLL